VIPALSCESKKYKTLQECKVIFYEWSCISPRVKTFDHKIWQAIVPACKIAFPSLRIARFRETMAQVKYRLPKLLLEFEHGSERSPDDFLEKTSRR
jgi:hypothetical protein